MKLYQVDAFADKPFEGNPAAVCITESPLDEATMQNIAMEMNLSETAFLVRKGEGFHLRWFTPASEVKLCGHATLASAHVLWSEGVVSVDETISFETLSGQLTALSDGDRIVLDFPAKMEEEVSPAEGLIEALGVTAKYVGKNQFDYLVEVGDEETVRQLTPDFTSLAKVPVRGVIVTAKAVEGSQYDFVSRFFAPAVGVNEDPVTGSAHCCLAPYWARELGKDKLLAYQASRRGGEVGLEVYSDRVKLMGKAVTVMKCEWLRN